MNKTDAAHTETLAVGLPFLGRGVVEEWAIALAVQSWPLNLKYSLYPVRGLKIDKGRQMLSELAQKHGSRFLLMWDDDIVPPIDAVRKLMNVMGQDPDVMVVVGICPCRQEPVEPNIYKEPCGGAFWQWKEGEVFEVAEAGTGFMLIRMSVFDHIQKPWFKSVDEVSVDDSNPEDGVVFRDQTTEDIYFCRGVKKAGFKIVAHGGVICQHWDISTKKCYQLPPDSYPFRK